MLTGGEREGVVRLGANLTRSMHCRPTHENGRSKRANTHQDQHQHKHKPAHIGTHATYVPSACSLAPLSTSLPCGLTAHSCNNTCVSTAAQYAASSQTRMRTRRHTPSGGRCTCLRSRTARVACSCQILSPCLLVAASSFKCKYLRAVQLCNSF